VSLANTVVINAAGTGTRLGLNLPKSMVEIGGISLIHRQLKQLEFLENITVVVGFRGRELVDHIWDIRRDIKIVINHNYLNTGTAGSLILGARTATNRVISLDGDLLIETNDLMNFVRQDADCVGVTSRKSNLPVLIELSDGKATRMGFEVESNFEWTGLLNIKKQAALGLGQKHVFEGLKAHLPIRAIPINCVEIDEPGDILGAESWLKESKSNYE
jgi:choline kinase